MAIALVRSSKYVVGATWLAPAKAPPQPNPLPPKSFRQSLIRTAACRRTVSEATRTLISRALAEYSHQTLESHNNPARELRRKLLGPAEIGGLIRQVYHKSKNSFSPENLHEAHDIVCRVERQHSPFADWLDKQGADRACDAWIHLGTRGFILDSWKKSLSLAIVAATYVYATLGQHVPDMNRDTDASDFTRVCFTLAGGAVCTAALGIGMAICTHQKSPPRLASRLFAAAAATAVTVTVGMRMADHKLYPCAPRAAQVAKVSTERQRFWGKDGTPIRPETRAAMWVTLADQTDDPVAAGKYRSNANYYLEMANMPLPR